MVIQREKEKKFERLKSTTYIWEIMKDRNFLNKDVKEGLAWRVIVDVCNALDFYE